jgi:hypothetical protein
MRNIKFYFGYMGKTRFDSITYWICNKFPFIPCLEVNLFRTYYNSNTYFVVKHQISIAWFKYMFEARKVRGKWRFEFIK